MLQCCPPSGDGRTSSNGSSSSSHGGDSPSPQLLHHPVALQASSPPMPFVAAAAEAAAAAAAASAAATSAEQQLMSSHMDMGAAAFLNAGGSAAEMAAWSGAALPPTAGYYSYDHPLSAYGYGGGYDLAQRRKNATRESTATLKAWLNEHKKNPYPTKGEKIMLAIITKMTLTQVSTWFANARRRLKKENKMTWEPKNKLDDEDVDVSDDDDKDDDNKHDDDLLHHHHPGLHPSHHLHHGLRAGLPPHMTSTARDVADENKSGIPVPPSKPKIWSLADTAVCKTPPPAAPMAAAQYGQHPGAHQQQQQQWAGHYDMTSRMRMFGQLSAAETDTPPHTPPNNNLKTGMGGVQQPGQQQGGQQQLAGLMGGMFNNGYNGLHNGYAAASALAAASGAAAGMGQQQHDASKLLSFQGLNSTTAVNGGVNSFKMM